MHLPTILEYEPLISENPTLITYRRYFVYQNTWNSEFPYFFHQDTIELPQHLLDKSSLSYIESEYLISKSCIKISQNRLTQFASQRKDGQLFDISLDSESPADEWMPDRILIFVSSDGDKSYISNGNESSKLDGNVLVIWEDEGRLSDFPFRSMADPLRERWDDKIKEFLQGNGNRNGLEYDSPRNRNNNELKTTTGIHCGRPETRRPGVVVQIVKKDEIYVPGEGAEETPDMNGLRPSYRAGDGSDKSNAEEYKNDSNSDSEESDSIIYNRKRLAKFEETNKSDKSKISTDNALKDDEKLTPKRNESTSYGKNDYKTGYTSTYTPNTYSRYGNWKDSNPAYFWSDPRIDINVLIETDGDIDSIQRTIGDAMTKASSVLFERHLRKYSGKLPFFVFYQTEHMRNRQYDAIRNIKDSRPRYFRVISMQTKIPRVELVEEEGYDEKEPIAILVDLVGVLDTSVPYRDINPLLFVEQYFSEERFLKCEEIVLKIKIPEDEKMLNESKSSQKSSKLRLQQNYWRKFTRLKSTSRDLKADKLGKGDEEGMWLADFQELFNRDILNKDWLNIREFQDDGRSKYTFEKGRYQNEDRSLGQFSRIEGRFARLLYLWECGLCLEGSIDPDDMEIPDLLYHANMPQFWLTKYKSLTNLCRMFEKHIDSADVPENAKARAHLGHGLCLLSGYGITKDEAKGMEAIEKSAKLGDFRARRLLSKFQKKFPDDTNEIYKYDTEVNNETLILDTEIIYSIENTTNGLAWREAGQIQFQSEVDAKFRNLHTVQFQIWGDWVIGALADFGGISKESILTEIKWGDLVNSQSQQPRLTFSVATCCFHIDEADNEQSLEDSYHNHTTCFGSLLHAAAAFNCKSVIPGLLKNGVGINRRSMFQALETPLLCALRNGHAEMAELLIENGAFLGSYCGRTSPHRFSPPLDENLLWNRNVGPSPFHYLVFLDEEEAIRIARILKVRGADINAKASTNIINDYEELSFEKGIYLDGLSVTPLKMALTYQKWKLAKKLLELGAKFSEMQVHSSNSVWVYDSFSQRKSRRKGPIEGVHHWNDSVYEQKGSFGFVNVPVLDEFCWDYAILEVYYFQLSKVRELQPKELRFGYTPMYLFLTQAQDLRFELQYGEKSAKEWIEMFKYLRRKQPEEDPAILGYAIMYNQLHLVRHMIFELEFDVHVYFKRMTPIQTAIYFDRLEIFQLLLKKNDRLMFAKTGPIPNSPNSQYTHRLNCLNLLINRLPHGNPETFHHYLKVLLPALRSSLTSDEDVDLMIDAITGNYPEFVQAMLSRGANRFALTAKPFGRGDFLYRALNERRGEKIPLLLMMFRQHNDFYAKTLKKYLKIFMEIPLEEQNLVSKEDLYFRESSRGTTIVHIMAACDRLVMDEDFLDMALSCLPKDAINVKDNDGDTPLHYACQSRSHRAVKKLLSLGAEPNTRNDYGLTPADSVAASVLFNEGIFVDPVKEIWHPNQDWSKYDNTLHPVGSRQYDWKENYDWNIAWVLAGLEEMGLIVDEKLKRLAVAFDHPVLKLELGDVIKEDFDMWYSFSGRIERMDRKEERKWAEDLTKALEKGKKKYGDGDLLISKWRKTERFAGEKSFEVLNGSLRADPLY